MNKFWTKTIYIMAAACSLTFSSCSDFLDRQEDEKLTFDKIWQSRNTIKQYWLNTMSFLPNENISNVIDNDPYLGAADEITVAYDRQYRKINFGSWNANNVPYDRFAKYYKGIRECNIFLQNVDRSSDPILTKDQIEEWKVQTRFARAYYYFLLMRDYGPVFLVGDELLDFAASTAELYRPRNTWEQCVDYVVAEMKACAENPSMLRQAELEKMNYGFATKGTCYAVISRLTLYSARDLYNGNTLYKSVKNPVVSEFPELSGVNLFPQEYKADKWLIAAEAARKVFEDGSYQLYRATSNNPYENYVGVINETWNSELIWTDRYCKINDWGLCTVPTSVGGTAYGSMGPTQQQVDAYAMNNGRYPIIGYESNGIPVIDPLSNYSKNEFEKTKWTYPSKGWSNKDNFDITAPNMYKDREPRFYVSIFFGGNYFIHGQSGATQGTMTSFAKGANGNKSQDFPKSGYLINRVYNHKLNSANGNWGNMTFPLFRLGETYLNFIEAVLECKKRGVVLPAGYEQEAMDKWADLRSRSGMSPITDSYPNASVEELIELCRKERRVELAFERHRYFDTRTWMIAEQTDNGPMYGMDTTCPLEKNMDSSETPDGFWKRVVFETRVFKSNHYLYPFSQRELDRNMILTQNYGW
ncbi:RagB/SusD family nutrient uptake outer membrane protein [Bacteroides faecium]|uniref:RagB/SusD family nutrient uptake outer membrane protein n=1 Tax=Bacteroides faecium TaxID=2715212 RepID=A0A6H0KIP5_9BACE|nr:RagB/SusD family nutrient uptake outer membrane protein [Bacteroides faecium]QIU93296.1 RagB/SusD family nutrient uptake outer membrane protein [Bacteroides faecium]